MLTALALSIGQLRDRAFLRVLAKSLALTVALLATFGVGLWFGARAAVEALGWSSSSSSIAGVAAVLAGAALGWLLFRAIAIAVVGLFADEIVAAVEARHYPAALASARPVPFARGAAMGARSALRTIAVNILASPLYLILLATGIGTGIAFFAVNAWLLGRDLGDMVAARHVPDLAAFRARTRGRRLALGGAGTALLLVPVINLVAPILSAAMATHLFHRSLAR